MGHKFPFMTAELEGLFDGSAAVWGQDVAAWGQDAFRQLAADCAANGMHNSGYCQIVGPCEIRWLALEYYLDGYESIFRRLLSDFDVRLTFDDWQVFYDVKASVESIDAQKLRNNYGC